MPEKPSYEELEQRVMEFEKADFKRKHTEHALKESMEQFRFIAEAIDDVFWLADVDIHKMLYVNPAYKKIWGLSQDALYETPRSFLDAIHIEDRERVIQKLQQKKRGQSFDFEYRIVRPDGEIRWIWDRGYPINLGSGPIIYYIGIAKDITEKKLAEEKLKLNEESYRILTENSLQGIAILKGISPVFVYVNKKLTEIFGYTADEKLSFDSEEIWIMIHPEDRPLVRQRNKDRLSGKNVISNYEFRIIRKDASTRWVEVFDSKLPSDGEVLSMAIYVDITERKLSENMLRESEEQFRRLFQYHSAVMLVFDLNTGNIVIANEAASGFYGWSVEELQKMQIQQINTMPPDAVKTEMEKAFLPGSFRAEYRHRKKDSSIRDVEVFRSPIDIVGKNCVFAIVHDITGRKEVEEKIQDSEQRFRAAFMGNPVAACITRQQDGVWVDTNQAELDLFGYTREEFIGKSALKTNIWADPTDRQRIVAALNRGEVVKNQYAQLRRKDNSLLMASVSATGLIIKGEKHILFVTEDITEQILANEKIKSALQEKEVLLREIHHRVKNNMQVISSLLFLQATRAENEQAKQALTESQQRVHAMAMIHETLYGSKNLSIIDLSVYLKTLVHHLQGVHQNQTNIRVDLDIDKVELDITQAVPCSLILNELITNAFKHAFSNVRTGEIRIKLHLVDNREILLEVSDNGIGLTTDIELIKPATLGMMLIQRLLKKQLNGNLDVVSEKGTTFTLRWPLLGPPFSGVSGGSVK